MVEYIKKSSVIDIMDDFWNRVNDSREFYLRLRKVLSDLPAEKIIRCKDCKYYCNILHQGAPFEYGKCSKSVFSRIFSNGTGPYDFCSKAEERK